MTGSGRTSLGAVGLATFVGTTLEFFDFAVYGLAAALVFDRVFFPHFSSAAGTLAAFATFGAGFVARPVGAILFGHFGDRVGRRPMLIASLALSGGSTLAIGLLPGYVTIGVVAPAILVLLRLLQGAGVGGELPGSVLLATEHAPGTRRAGYASFTAAGTQVGALLANVIMLVLSATLSDEAFRSWGWRIPFLAGGLLLAVGLYVRLAISETPIFTGKAALAPRPVWEAIRRRPGLLLAATGALLVATTMSSMVLTFSLAYGVGLGVPRTAMLTAVLIATASLLCAIPLVALLSDRVGRRPLCLASAIGVAIWSVPMLALINTRSPPWITVALVVALLIVSLMFAPILAYLPELFDTRTRFSSVAVSYSAATVLGAGLFPFIATALVAATGTAWSVTVYLAGTAVVSLACVLLLPETHRRDLSDSLGVRHGDQS